MGFADNLKQIRRDRNISQEELAELLGVSRQAVSKWEQGAGYPEVDKLLLLSNKLNLSLDSLMSGEIPAPADSPQSTSQPVKTGKILIASFDGRALVSCYKVQSSSMFRTKADEPKYALFGIDGSSFWGEHTTLLGWYADEKNLQKEVGEIMQALQDGKDSYSLRYAVKVKRHWGKIKIVD